MEVVGQEDVGKELKRETSFDFPQSREEVLAKGRGTEELDSFVGSHGNKVEGARGGGMGPLLHRRLDSTTTAGAEHLFRTGGELRGGERAART